MVTNAKLNYLYCCLVCMILCPTMAWASDPCGNPIKLYCAMCKEEYIEEPCNDCSSSSEGGPVYGVDEGVTCTPAASPPWEPCSGGQCLCQLLQFAVSARCAKDRSIHYYYPRKCCEIIS